MPSTAHRFMTLAGHYTPIALGGHRYGIATHRVCLVTSTEHALPAANLPPAVRHVLYCSGRLVPVVDLRFKFQLNDNSGPDARIVVVRAQLPGLPSLPLGMWVDDVRETLQVAPEDLRPARHGLPLPIVARTTGPLHGLLDLDLAINPWELTPAVEHAAVA